MPLPINATLSLLGASRPGDPSPSNPKKAMLVRMSSEILDALEASNQPAVQFEFGENPGLFIGDTCFNMVHSQETAVHELYLRAASATKRSAPLKLYAKVVGKFTVGKREIGNGLRDKIRESTQDAVALKNSRATVFMDTPPEPQLTNKKRKDVSMFRKPIRQPEKVKPAASVSTPPNKATPTYQSSSSNGGVPVLKRLVHCLARGDKSEEELFRLLGGDRNASLRSEMIHLLDQFAELKSDKSGNIYILNSLGWKEVRPWEWPGLNENERIQLARTGRMNLKRLGIPESDVLWNYFHFKKPQATLYSSNATSSTDARSSIPKAPTNDKLLSEQPKRGVSSRELKEKKAKPKGDTRAEIQMKDESQRGSKPQPAGSARESKQASTDPSSTRARRPSDATHMKPPVPQGIEKEPYTSSPAHSKPSTSQTEKTQAQKFKRLREGDIHGSDYEKRVKEKDGVASKLPKTKVTVEDKNIKAVRKPLDEESSKGSLKRKAKDEPEGVNVNNLKRRAVEEDKSRKPAKIKSHEDDELPSSSKPKTLNKRKAEDLDGAYEPIPKKPRPEQDPTSSKLSSSSGQRKEYMASKKSEIQSPMNQGNLTGKTGIRSSSTPTMKKESPAPSVKPNPILGGRERDQQRSSAISNSSSKPTKLRRRSPVYTSSEEDESVLAPTKPSATPPTNKLEKALNPSSPPLPPDNNPRAEYHKIYLEYLPVMHKLLMQKGKLDKMLKIEKLDSSGTISDSEGDVELLPPEDLEVLTKNHKKLHTELQAIQETFGRRTN